MRRSPSSVSRHGPPTAAGLPCGPPWTKSTRGGGSVVHMRKNPTAQPSAQRKGNDAQHHHQFFLDCWVPGSGPNQRTTAPAFEGPCVHIDQTVADRRARHKDFARRLDSLDGESDAQGQFALKSVPPQQLHTHGNAPGLRHAGTVAYCRSVSKSAGMKLVAVADSTTVTASTEQVDTKESSGSTTIGESMVEHMPNR
jgi:hypothetical protein